MNDVARRNRELIANYIEMGATASVSECLGLELEHILVRKSTHEPVSYSEKNGVHDLLAAMAPAYNSTIELDGALIGLERDDSNISIEPAGQLEISVAPCPTLRCITIAYDAFRNVVDPLAESMDIELVNLGYHPTGVARQLELIPKRRYELMDQHFSRTGKHGVCMMRGSASTQVSIDYTDEADAIRKFKIANLLGPLLSFITDNSPILDGHVVGRMVRTRIWDDVDAERSMVVPGLFREGYDTPYSFTDYADYIMRSHPILTMDGDEAVDAEGRTADEIYVDRELSEPDVEHLLSMFFPDVRLKRYIEIRMADDMPIEYATAYAALIRGIFYDEGNLTAIEELLGSGTPLDDDSVPRTKAQLMERSWLADVYGIPAYRWLDELVALAYGGLRTTERDALAPLAHLVEARSTLFDRAFDGGDEAPLWVHELCQREAPPSLLPSMHGLSAEYRATVEALDGDKPGRIAADRLFRKSTAIYHGELVDSCYVPLMVTPRAERGFNYIARTTYDICVRMTKRYREDADYRALFGFDELTDSLIRLDCGYPELLPIVRMDIFLQQDAPEYDADDLTFTFCEINTDGASAMNEDRELSKALMATLSFQNMRDRFDLAPQSLFDPLVRLVESSYRQWCSGRGWQPKAHPHVAIVDFPGSATSYEFEEFVRRFERNGMPCAIEDIAKLSFDGETLRGADGQPIDCVYRRAVTSEVVGSYPEVHALIDAAKANAVPLVGAFQTQVPHSKKAFELMWHPATHEILTQEQCAFIERHVPYTAALDAKALAEHDIRNNRNAWLLKPAEGYGASGIVAGVNCTQEQWDSALDTLGNGSYMVQAYAKQYSEPEIPVLAPQETTWKPLNEMIGLFIYGGRFSGTYLRSNAGNVIGGSWGASTIASFHAHDAR